MKLSVSNLEAVGYLAVAVKGEWNLSDVKELIDALVTEVKQRGQAHLFVDASNLSGNPEELDRFLLGEHVAVALRHVELAVVYRADLINKLFQHTATNRGGQVLVVADQQEALAWLLAGTPLQADARACLPAGT